MVVGKQVRTTRMTGDQSSLWMMANKPKVFETGEE
jgi:hypothetical protein